MDLRDTQTIDEISVVTKSDSDASCILRADAKASTESKRLRACSGRSRSDN